MTIPKYNELLYGFMISKYEINWNHIYICICHLSHATKKYECEYEYICFTIGYNWRMWSLPEVSCISPHLLQDTFEHLQWLCPKDQQVVYRLECIAALKEEKRNGSFCALKLKPTLISLSHPKLTSKKTVLLFVFSFFGGIIIISNIILHNSYIYI